MKIKIYLFLACISLTLSTQAQSVLNGGFEDSTITVNDTVPTHWSADYFGFAFSPDAHSGAAAASIWNWYSYAKGWIVYGAAVDPYSGGGLPIAFNPDKLTGYYKYIYGLNGGAADSAICEVLLYSHQGFTGARDTLAHMIHKLGPAAEYTPFEVPFDYRIQGLAADTVVIRFMSSESGFCNPANECLYLYVDDLELSTTVGTQPVLAPQPTAIVYPSPSSHGFSVRLAPDQYPAQFTLTDMLGRHVFTQTLRSADGAMIDPHLPAGNYAWEVLGSDGWRYVGKWVAGE